MSAASRWGFLRDEEGAWSMGRLGLAYHSLITWLLIACDSFVSWVSVPVSAYALLGTIFTGFLAWVAGPRIAKHLGPALQSFRIRGADQPKGAWLDNLRGESEADEPR